MALGSGPDTVTALWLAYDGGDFSGFQVQPGAPTVQARLEDALARLSDSQVRVHPAGRTDAGVHAAGQVVSFNWRGTVPVEQLPKALNSLLPPTISVWEAREMPPGFHARKSARSKRYLYFIQCQETPSPFCSQFSLHWRGELDLAAMREAASQWVGTHDFGAFQVAGRPVASTIRTVTDLSLTRLERTILIRAEGDGFLYKMVRSMVGTLLEVGRGATSASQARQIILSGSRVEAGPTAPAKGLFLWSVDYGEGPKADGSGFRPFLTPLEIT